MPSSYRIALLVGLIGLALSLVLTVGLLWPSPQQVITLTLRAESPGPSASSGGQATPESPQGAPPTLTLLGGTLRMAMPKTLLQGRHESMELSIEAPPGETPSAVGVNLVAEIESFYLTVYPPGAFEQPYRTPLRIRWTIIGRQPGAGVATVLLRLRQPTTAASPAAERLILARDVPVEVHTLFGLTAQAAAWVAAGSALLSALLLALAAALRRRRA